MEFNLIKLHRRNNKRRESSKERKSTPPSPRPPGHLRSFPTNPELESRQRGGFTLFNLVRSKRGKFIKFHLRHLIFWHCERQSDSWVCRCLLLPPIVLNPVQFNRLLIVISLLKQKQCG